MIASSIKAEVVKANGRAANDTGSPEVQVALLTARILIYRLSSTLKAASKEELRVLKVATSARAKY